MNARACSWCVYVQTNTNGTVCVLFCRIWLKIVFWLVQRSKKSLKRPSKPAEGFISQLGYFHPISFSRYKTAIVYFMKGAKLVKKEMIKKMKYFIYFFSIVKVFCKKHNVYFNCYIITLMVEDINILWVNSPCFWIRRWQIYL